MNTVETITHLTAYCERSGDPSFWAEPLNALTNFAFIVSAGILFNQWVKLPDRRLMRVGDLLLLIVLIAIIGFGSGLWHTLATPWSLLVDVIPIALFINVYIFVIYRRVVHWSWWKIILLWLLFHILSFIGQSFFSQQTLNGSIFYIPTFLLLIFTNVLVYFNVKERFYSLFLSTGIFFISLIFRTLDLEFCAGIHVGTHFIWHVFNAIVLYRLTSLVIKTS